MEKIMAVYDVDVRYARRFADVVNQKERTPFSVIPFSTFERLKEYGQTHEIEILLISLSVPQNRIREIRAGTVVTLAEGEIVAAAGDYPSVYKYQSADGLIREVMSCYCSQPEQEAWKVLGRKARVYGVYSPIGRCLKTSLALTMGQQLAREGKTLYVSFEEFSGLSGILGESAREDLSSVLYYFRQGGLNVVRLTSLVHGWKELDYIPPVRCPEDLGQLEGEEAGKLMEALASEMGYEYLVADLGRPGRCLPGLLEACSRIYMPVKEDAVSAAKLEEFDRYLEASGRKELRERITRIRLPYHSSFGRRSDYMDQLLWGELGDYVRQLLKGGKRT